MPDLMGSEFIQIKEAIDAAWELIGSHHFVLIKDRVIAEPTSYIEAVIKIQKARELMVDLAGGNSR